MLEIILYLNPKNAQFQNWNSSQLSAWANKCHLDNSWDWSLSMVWDGLIFSFKSLYNHLIMQMDFNLSDYFLQFWSYLKFILNSFFLELFPELLARSWSISDTMSSRHYGGFYLQISKCRKVCLGGRDSRWMSYEPAAILNQNLPYIPHIIG